eukprot:2064582-Rhodomonas_salina.2
MRDGGRHNWQARSDNYEAPLFFFFTTWSSARPAARARIGYGATETRGVIEDSTTDARTDIGYRATDARTDIGYGATETSGNI